LDREFFGTLTATLIPPCLAIATGILEAILAVRQGVKCVSLGYAEQGNRIQDVAAIETLGKMANEVVRNLGYKNIQVNAVFHQYMAAFPEAAHRAEDLIYNSGITGALSRATRIITKTPVEAYRIPSLEDNIQGLRLAMSGVSRAAHLEIDHAKVTEESAIIRREVQAILDSIVVCGRGCIAEGVVKGFEKGYLDIPFSPSIYNKGEIMTARDASGAVRFLSIGNIQFDRELRQFHEHKMAERRRVEGLFSSKENYLLVEQDVMRIPRGEYERWPLYG
jgi:methylaspartate mutase epsilon subunit